MIDLRSLTCGDLDRTVKLTAPTGETITGTLQRVSHTMLGDEPLATLTLHTIFGAIDFNDYAAQSFDVTFTD